MTNREKYKEEILDLLRTNNCAKLETFYNTYVATQYSISDYDRISWFEIIFAITLWLGEEYEEPKVDWSKVKMDTPVLVKNHEGHMWFPRHFAKCDNYGNNEVFTWKAGKTSWSTLDGMVDKWKYAKLATENASEEILIKL